MPKVSRSGIAALTLGTLLLGLVFFAWKMKGAQRTSKNPASTPPSQSSKSSGSSGTDWKTTLDETLSEPAPGLRSAQFGRNLQAWFEEDPEGALAYLQGLPPGNEYTAGLLVVLGGIAETDPERALRLAQEMALQSEDLILYSALFSQFAESDIAKAQSLLALVPQGEALTRATRALVTHWASEDFTSAWEWAQSLQGKDTHHTALEAALAIRAKTDPENAFLLAQDNLTGKAMDRILLETIRELIARDPHHASGFVSQLPAGEVRDATVLNVVRALAVEQPDAVLEWLEGFEDGRLRDLAMNNLLDVWSETDPAAAMDFVNKLPSGESLNLAAAQLADNLGRKDPQTAFTWAENLPTVEARDAAWLALSSSWARHQPAETVQWVASFPQDVSIRQEALQSAFSYWALLDPEKASDFVPQLSETEQPTAINSVAYPLTQESPQAALSWAQSFQNEDIQMLAVDAVVRGWSRISPQDTSAWVMTQPESHLRIDLARAVTENWYVRDPGDTSNWVLSLPAGPTRDGALDMLADQLSATNLPQALEVASAIDSPPLRQARTELLQNQAGE